MNLKKVPFVLGLGLCVWEDKIFAHTHTHKNDGLLWVFLMSECRLGIHGMQRLSVVKNKVRVENAVKATTPMLCFLTPQVCLNQLIIVNINIQVCRTTVEVKIYFCAVEVRL